MLNQFPPKNPKFCETWKNFSFWQKYSIFFKNYQFVHKKYGCICPKIGHYWPFSPTQHVDFPKQVDISLFSGFFMICGYKIPYLLYNQL